MAYLLFLMRLLMTLLLVAATEHASESNFVEESTFWSDDAAETQTETGDWETLKTSMTTTAGDDQQNFGMTLPDDGSGARSEQPLDDQLNQVDEGRHLMERFYQRYNTTAHVDLVFVLDRSGSVPEKGWHSVIEFVKVGAVGDLSN